MKLTVDKEADALYLRLDDSSIVQTEEVSPGVILDYQRSQGSRGRGTTLSVKEVPGDGFGGPAI